MRLISALRKFASVTSGWIAKIFCFVNIRLAVAMAKDVFPGVLAFKGGIARVGLVQIVSFEL